MSDKDAGATGADTGSANTPPAADAGGSVSGTAPPAGGTGTGTAPAADAAGAGVASDKGAAPDKAAPGTLADGNDGTAAPGKTADAKDGKTADASDWRAPLAGEDKKFLERLTRFTSPSEFAKSYRALEQKLSSGEYKRVLPENATEDQVKAWRKEQDIPEAPEGYGDPKLPNGIVPGPKDNPMVALFDKFAHQNNFSVKQRNDVLAWHYETQDALRSMQQDTDAAFKTKVEDELRTEWGADYRRNLNAIGSLKAQMPEGLAGRILAGRTADGVPVGNDPAFLKWFAQLAFDLNPAASLIPNAGGSPGKSVETELEDIRKFRRENPDGYDADKKMQARELQLLDAHQKLQARGKAA